MEKICIVTTIKASLQQTLMFVAYHLNIGVDNIILFFSEPGDEAIATLSNIPQVICIPCDRAHWNQQGIEHPEELTLSQRQYINADVGLAIARSQGIDWISHIDSDELIYSEQDVKAILADYDADIVRLEPYEAVADTEVCANAFDARLFKQLGSNIQMILAKLTGCHNAFYRGQFYRGHVKSKVWVRTQAMIKHMNAHLPEALPGYHLKLIHSKQIQLLHYDAIGLETWKEKWIQRVDGSITLDVRNNRNQQLLDFRKVYEQGEESLISWYRRLYVLPEREQWILQKLHLLTCIKIDNKEFDLTQYFPQKYL